MATPLLEIVGGCTEDDETTQKPCRCKAFKKAQDGASNCLCGHSIVYHVTTYLNPTTYEPVMLPNFSTGGSAVSRKTSPRSAQLASLVSKINQSASVTSSPNPPTANFVRAGKNARLASAGHRVDDDDESEEQTAEPAKKLGDVVGNSGTENKNKPSSTATIGSKLAGGLQVKNSIPKHLSNQVFHYFTTGATSNAPSGSSSAHARDSGNNGGPQFISVPASDFSLPRPNASKSRKKAGTKRKKGHAGKKKANKKKKASSDESDNSSIEVPYAPSVASEDDETGSEEEHEATLPISVASNQASRMKTGQSSNRSSSQGNHFIPPPQRLSTQADSSATVDRTLQGHQRQQQQQRHHHHHHHHQREPPPQQQQQQQQRQLAFGNGSDDVENGSAGDEGFMTEDVLSIVQRRMVPTTRKVSDAEGRRIAASLGGPREARGSDTTHPGYTVSDTDNTLYRGNFNSDVVLHPASYCYTCLSQFETESRVMCHVCKRYVHQQCSDWRGGTVSARVLHCCLCLQHVMRYNSSQNSLYYSNSDEDMAGAFDARTANREKKGNKRRRKDTSKS